MSRSSRLAISIAGVVASLVLCAGARAEVVMTVSPSAGPASLSCVVPRLIGNELQSAKRKLRRADCRIGKVKKIAGASATNGKIIAQSARPGAILPPGSRINVALDG
jgi:beta-lactam-binding protein with PASTA domain